MWPDWHFRYPFRKYQRLILNEIEDVVDTPRDDRRYHLVAPPGSGKTVVGLELIRRFGRPALVLAPTTTIQMQWREQARLFLSADTGIDQWVSTDPDRLAPVTVLTYQRLAVQDPKQPFARAAAHKAWAESLVTQGQAANAEAAEAYLARLASQNPDAYQRELRRRYPAIKRRLLRADPADVARFLHPNALALIQNLVAHGLGTIVLDECHHLLDYWAVVLRYLIAQLENPRVVGLTATLPSPEDDFAYENYTILLGEVDFEIPTPAVVKEGNLAPYRSLVYFTAPTAEESAYLKHVEDHFEQVSHQVLESDHFLGWLAPLLTETWQQETDENPTFALAGLRWLYVRQALPPQVPVPEQALQPPTIDDQLVLLEQYALRRLLPSDDPEDHRRYQELRRLLRPLGFTLTARGLRQGRTPGDLVLSFSLNKTRAVADILRHEAEALGERLRAVVVTDFERRTSSLHRYIKTRHDMPMPLDEEAGSARAVFRFLVGLPELAALKPVLVTGNALWVHPDLRAPLEAAARALDAALSLRFEPQDGFLEVNGDGGAWGTGVYVPLLTRLFEAGETRCMVGTRGLFGEGWDALSLNTLIDLTTVTTSVGVQQLRGRSLRLSPRWKHKVAHNWDVICVAPRFSKGGDLDLRRLVRRHNRLWGVVQYAPTSAYLNNGLLQTLAQQGELKRQWERQVARGVLHIDPVLAVDLFTKKWQRVNYGGYTRLMLGTLTASREETYEAWEVGEEYSNFDYRVRQIRPRDMHIRTVYTLEESVKVLLRSLRNAFAGATSTGLLAAWYISARSPTLQTWLLSLVVVFGIVTLGMLAFEAPKIWRILRKLGSDQPADAILLDVARALLVALRESGLVSRKLQPDYVRVVANPDGTYSVMLDYASPADAALFTQAFGEIFAPVIDQRYLILRTDGRLPHILTTDLWRLVRVFASRSQPPAYHPVPGVLATNKKRAQAFARAWRRYVGGGELVYTRSPEGRQRLYAARAQIRPKVDSWAFDFWR